MMLSLYNSIARLLVPLALMRLWVKSLRNPGYRRSMLRRLGWNLGPPVKSPVIWFHAVSVGETLASAPLIDALLAASPDSELLVTSTTPTGAAQVERLFGERVLSTWFPFDTPGAVRRFFRHYQPALVLLMETEIWPNVVLTSHALGVPVLLVNARLSQRALQRYLRVGRLTRRVVGAIDHVLAQTDADAERLARLGARRVTVCGNLKFDIDQPALSQQIAQLQIIFGVGFQRPVVAAVSTHPAEEAMCAKAFQTVRETYPQALLLLAPRHPERVDGLMKEVWLRELTPVRRSDNRPPEAINGAFILDTLGELSAMLAWADVVFVGGSLIAHGGHNPLEAAVLGKPILTGHYVHNFAGIYEGLEAAGGAAFVADVQGLAVQWCALLSDETLRAQQGSRALAWAGAHGGALERQLAAIVPRLPGPIEPD